MSELQVGPSTSPDVQQIDLPLAGLAAGEYILEIKAGDDASIYEDAENKTRYLAVKGCGIIKLEPKKWNQNGNG